MNQTPQSNVPHTFLAASSIKRLREERGLTQRALAESLGVTDKAVSKWESGRGLPDISLVEPLAQRLGISVAELLAGDIRANANRAGNMLKGVFYVCPICGNVVHALGEGSFSCCGSTMFPQEAEEPDADHAFSIERIEDDWYVTLDHPMTKDHYISFVAYGWHLPQEALSRAIGATAFSYHRTRQNVPLLQPARTLCFADASQVKARCPPDAPAPTSCGGIVPESAGLEPKQELFHRNLGGRLEARWGRIVI